MTIKVTDEAVDRAFVTWRTATSTREGMRRVLEQFAASAHVASCAVNVTELAGMVNKELASMGLVLASAPAPVEDAVKAEREACAKIAEYTHDIGVRGEAARNIAKAIRARSEP